MTENPTSKLIPKLKVNEDQLPVFFGPTLLVLISSVILFFQKIVLIYVYLMSFSCKKKQT